MRTFAAIVAFFAAGIGGAVTLGGAAFFGLFCLCRAISWATGHRDFMWLMLAGYLLCPMFAFGGFVGFGSFAFACVAGSAPNGQTRGFEVRTTRETDAR